MLDDGEGVGETVEHILRDPVEVAVQADRLLVLVCDPFGYADHGCSRDVERHREEHLLSLHPLEPCHHVRHDVRPPVAHVHGAARVRERHVQVIFLCFRGIGLKGMGPPLVRFFLEFCQRKFAHVLHPSVIPVSA